MFYVFNVGLMAILGLLLAFTIVVGTAETAAQGEFMGRKQQAPQFLIFRNVLSVALLVPQFNNYNAIQYMIMSVATQGAYFADSLWGEVENIVNVSGSVVPFVKLAPQQTNVSDNTSADSEDMVINNFKNANLSTTITATENILKFHACVDYLQVQQQSYDQCVQYYGDTNEKVVCAQTTRCDILNIDQSTYTVSLKSLSMPPQDTGAGSQAPICGNLTLNLTAINDIDTKNEYWQIFLDELFYPLAGSNNSNFYNCGYDSATTTPPPYNANNLLYSPIYDAYYNCEDGTTCTPPTYVDDPACQSQFTQGDPFTCGGTNATDIADSVVAEDFVGNPNIYNNTVGQSSSTSASPQGSIVDNYLQALGEQSWTVSSDTNNTSTTGSSQSYLSFVPGGWITAGTSYSTLAFHLVNLSTNPVMTYPPIQLKSYSAGNTSFQDIDQYILPSATYDLNPSSTSAPTTPFSFDLFMQTWYSLNPYPMQANSTATTTGSPYAVGWAIYACLTGASEVYGQKCSDFPMYPSDPSSSVTSIPMPNSDPTYPLNNPIPDDVKMHNLQDPGSTTDPSSPSNSSTYFPEFYLPLGFISAGYNYMYNQYSPPSSDSSSSSSSSSGGLIGNLVTGYNKMVDGTTDLADTTADSFKWYFGQFSYQDVFGDAVNTYINRLIMASTVAFFGGYDAFSLVDPVFRMQNYGLSIIDISLTYFSAVISKAINFASDVLFTWFLTVQILVYALTLITILGSAIAMLLYTLAMWLIATGVGLLGSILLIPVGIILIALGVVVLFTSMTVLFLFYAGSMTMTVICSLVPIYLQFLFLTVFKWFDVYVYLAIPLFILGGYMGIFVALAPFLVFLMTVTGWYFLVVEAMIAGPIIALGIAYAQASHDVFGRSEALVSLLIILFLRPAAIVIGFIFGIILASASLYLLNIILFPVFVDMIGYVWGNPGLSLTLSEAFLSGDNAAGQALNLDTTQLLTLWGVGMLYAYIAASVVYQCFSLTYVVPFRMIRWIDPRAGESIEEVQGSMNDAKQLFVQEFVTGLANGIASLTQLSQRMFAMVGAHTGTGGAFQQPSVDTTLPDTSGSDQAPSASGTNTTKSE
tara:strand:+ start:57 stop:3332 length:3276 start_codon:yes stop_codon:yes gene_type:complete